MNQTVIHPFPQALRSVGVALVRISAVHGPLVRTVLLSTMLAAALTAPAYAAVPSAAAFPDAAAAPEADGEELGPPSELRTLGSGAQAFYLVEHGEKISIYVDGVPADYMLEQLRSVDGPTYRSRVSLTRPITMSLHRVTWRAMFERMLRGLNVSYHYKGWRIGHIRVLSLVPGRNYKVAPRPSERKEIWMQTEIGNDGGLR